MTRGGGDKGVELDRMTLHFPELSNIEGVTGAEQMFSIAA